TRSGREDFAGLLGSEARVALEEPGGVSKRHVDRTDGCRCATPYTHVTNLSRSIKDSPRIGGCCARTTRPCSHPGDPQGPQGRSTGVTSVRCRVADRTAGRIVRRLRVASPERLRWLPVPRWPPPGPMPSAARRCWWQPRLRNGARSDLRS